MAASLNNPPWLEWMATLMGGVSRQPYAATLPPDRFRCLLDELPLHLIPQRGRRVLCGQGQVSGNTPLFMNPECRLLPGGQAPEQFADCGDLLERFAQQFTIAWVRDPVSEYLLPFWLSPQLESVVRDLKPGEPAPATLPSDMRSLLSAAGILIPHDYILCGNGSGKRSSENQVHGFARRGAFQCQI